MTTLYFRADGVHLEQLFAKPVTTHNVGTIAAQFEFDHTWDGYEKTVVFFQNRSQAYHVLLDQASCIIPSEVLVTPGEFFLGVFGVKDQKRLTTNLIPIGLRQGAYLKGQTPSAPAQEVYEQIISMLATNSSSMASLNAECAEIKEEYRDISESFQSIHEKILVAQEQCSNVMTSAQAVSENTALAEKHAANALASKQDALLAKEEVQAAAAQAQAGADEANAAAVSAQASEQAAAVDSAAAQQAASDAQSAVTAHDACATAHSALFQGKANLETVRGLQAELDRLSGQVGYTDADIYGVEVDFVNQTFTRLAGAAGKSAGVEFDAISAFGGRTRCILTDDGKELARYGEPGYTESGALTQELTKDGTIYPVGTLVQVMVRQPKFYYRIVPIQLEPSSSGKGYLTRKMRYYLTMEPRPSFHVHPAFVQDGQERDTIYLAAYETSLYSTEFSGYVLSEENHHVANLAEGTGDKLCSIAAAKPANTLKRSDCRRLAANRGPGWSLAHAATLCATHLLMLIEYASFNMRASVGRGAIFKVDDGQTCMAEATGGTSSLGNASGASTNANGVELVSYRGEENLWGNLWTWVDGINEYVDPVSHQAMIYLADHAFSDNTMDPPYADAGITPFCGSGYVSAFCYSPQCDWLFLPGECSGSSTLPIGDFYWNQNTGWRVAMTGGYWASSTSAGAFYWSLANGKDNHGRTTGARIVFVPQASQN